MLKIVFRNKPRNLPKAEGRGSGPQGRINKIRKLVTALVRHERIEGYHHYLDESRGYAERLIQEAVKHGDSHAETMETADYYLLEKDLVHKLFKVLVPRYTNCHTSFTQMWNLPTVYPGKPFKMSVLELRGNPWPSVVPHVRDVRGNLINVLLDGLRKDNTKFKPETTRQQLETVDSRLEEQEELEKQLDLELTFNDKLRVDEPVDSKTDSK